MAGSQAWESVAVSISARVFGHWTVWALFSFCTSYSRGERRLEIGLHPSVLILSSVLVGCGGKKRWGLAGEVSCEVNQAADDFLTEPSLSRGPLTIFGQDDQNRTHPFQRCFESCLASRAKTSYITQELLNPQLRQLLRHWYRAIGKWTSRSPTFLGFLFELRRRIHFVLRLLQCKTTGIMYHSLFWQVLVRGLVFDALVHSQTPCVF